MAHSFRGDRNPTASPAAGSAVNHLSLKVNQASAIQDHDGLCNRGGSSPATTRAGPTPVDDGIEDGHEGRHGRLVH
jgi:hypothetical protein